MDPIGFGARQAVVNCVKVEPGDKTVIITDHETKKMAEAIAIQVEAVGGFVRRFIMEDFGPRPDDASRSLRFPAEIRAAMSKAQASFYIASTRIGELGSFRWPMTDVVEKYRLRHAHMPGFTKEMMCQGMGVDYNKIRGLCRRVHRIVSRARRITVTTPAGTDLSITLSPKLKWLICDGDIRPGQWTNLPDGEVFTSPADSNGIVVIDGCMGDIATRDFGGMRGTPLSYQMRDNRCIRSSVHCKNKALKKAFDRYTFGTDANSDRAGEFAIGTNIGLKKLIGIMLQDEKFPSVHLALGNPLPNWTGARWTSKAHNDGLMLKPTVVADGKMIMRAGKFLI